MVAFATEVELARKVKTWFEEMGYTVYQEVQDEQGGPIADLVAKRGNTIYVVETKLHLGLGVIEQAVGWMGSVNRASVAIPAPGPRGVSPRRHYVMRKLGLGLLGVSESGVTELIGPASRRRNETSTLEDRLTDEQREWKGAEAGTDRGGHMTQFARTALRFREHVTAYPDPDGVKVPDVVAAIHHHYHTAEFAVAKLTQLVKKGAIRGVRCTGQGKLLRVFPVMDEGDSR